MRASPPRTPAAPAAVRSTTPLAPLTATTVSVPAPSANDTPSSATANPASPAPVTKGVKRAFVADSSWSPTERSRAVAATSVSTEATPPGSSAVESNRRVADLLDAEAPRTLTTESSPRASSANVAPAPAPLRTSVDALVVTKRSRGDVASPPTAAASTLMTVPVAISAVALSSAANATAASIDTRSLTANGAEPAGRSSPRSRARPVRSRRSARQRRPPTRCPVPGRRSRRWRRRGVLARLRTGLVDDLDRRRVSIRGRHRDRLVGGGLVAAGRRGPASPVTTASLAGSTSSATGSLVSSLAASAGSTAIARNGRLRPVAIAANTRPSAPASWPTAR